MYRFTYWKDKITEKRQERMSICWFTSAVAGAGLAKARRLECRIGFPCGYSGPLLSQVAGLKVGVLHMA